MMNNGAFDITLTPRQKLAWNEMRNPSVMDLMYGGAKGGGKSVFFVAFVVAYCYMICEMFNLKPSHTPPHVGWMGRKQAVDFTATTLETWKEWVPEEYYVIKSGTEKAGKHILLWDRIAMDFGGLDRRESINKFNSAEYGIIAIDQAEETTKDEVSVLRASRRLKINGKHLPYKGLFTANPAKCWLKDEFITSPRENYRFIQALPSDNPHLPNSYIQTLKDAFSHRPELLAAYLDGSWDIADDAGQLIKSAQLLAAYSIDRLQFATEKRRLLTCDVARYGDDETVIYDMEETDIVDAEIYGQKDTMFTANTLARMSMDRDDCLIAVDEGGVGGGVIDRLKELKRTVIAINSSHKSDDPKYYNRRAEIWDNAAKMFADGDIELHWQDDQLKGQLTTPTYLYRNSKILIEPKDDIKERLGRSPDRGDAYVNGLFALRYVKPKTQRKSKSSVPSFIQCGVG